VSVRHIVRRPLDWVLGRAGFKLVPPAANSLPTDFDPVHVDVWRAVAPHTMTSPEAVYTLVEAVRHVTSSSVPGAIVECGVWRGGSMLAVARTLVEMGQTERELYLFDTFEGMPEPTEVDVVWSGESASDLLAASDEDSELWARAPLAGVRQVMASSGYPAERVHFLQCKVEDTLPDHAPDEIALLRLDTDWYSSTRHELLHLYPRLAVGGVLILDDYEWWHGAGKATDEYFAANAPAPFLVRIDGVGRRVAVKVRG
jgi:O-methyltransferase